MSKKETLVYIKNRYGSFMTPTDNEHLQEVLDSSEDELKYIALGKAFETLLTFDQCYNLGSAGRGDPEYQHAGFNFTHPCGVNEAENIKSREDSKWSWSSLFTMIIARTGKNLNKPEARATLKDLIEHFSEENK